jgi:signal transduction histidine kinase
VSPVESNSKSKPADLSGWRLAWRRLGDTGVISWTTFWVTFALVSVDLLIGLAESSPLAAIAAAVVTQAVIFGLLGLARLIYLRRSFARRHPIIMLVTIIFASVVGVLFGEIAGLLVAPPSSEWGVIALDGATFRIVIIVIVGIFAVSLRDYRTSIQELEVAREQLLQTRQRGEQAFQEERDGIIARVTAMLDEALAAVSAEHPIESERVLRATAEDVVRPLSHELAMTGPQFSAPVSPDASVISWRSILDEVTSTPIIRPILTAIAVTLFSIRFTLSEPPEDMMAGSGVGEGAAVLVDVSSLGRSLLFLATVFFSVWASSVLVGRGTARFLRTATLPSRIAVIVASVIAVIGAMQIAIQVLVILLPDTGLESSFWPRLFAVIPIFLVAVAVGTVRAVSVRWTLTRHFLQDTNDDLAWEVAKIREALWQQRRSLARALHGPLKSAIIAGSFQILAATLKGAAVPTDVVDSVRANINAALGGLQVHSADAVDLDHQIALLERTWSGVCELHVDAPDAVRERLAADHVCAAATVDIVGEAVANAAIHARARNAWITLAMDGHRLLQITVRDDGTTALAEPVPGLGSQILDEVCTDWDLQVSASGSTLQAALPIS